MQARRETLKELTLVNSINSHDKDFKDFEIVYFKIQANALETT